MARTGRPCARGRRGHRALTLGRRLSQRTGAIDPRRPSSSVSPSPRRGSRARRRRAGRSTYRRSRTGREGLATRDSGVPASRASTSRRSQRQPPGLGHDARVDVPRAARGAGARHDRPLLALDPAASVIAWSWWTTQLRVVVELEAGGREPGAEVGVLEEERQALVEAAGVEQEGALRRDVGGVEVLGRGRAGRERRECELAARSSHRINGVMVKGGAHSTLPEDGVGSARDARRAAPYAQRAARGGRRGVVAEEEDDVAAGSSQPRLRAALAPRASARGAAMQSEREVRRQRLERGGGAVAWSRCRPRAPRPRRGRALLGEAVERGAERPAAGRASG